MCDPCEEGDSDAQGHPVGGEDSWDLSSYAKPEVSSGRLLSSSDGTSVAAKLSLLVLYPVCEKKLQGTIHSIFGKETEK